ncbi:MAG: zinc-binding dehydrogenase [Gemmatimonadota bacterium]|jgi:NADPH:quinone reductase-like Zn-dependent oxidoreductase|nr:MAG: zinc-binding dehydrogenase [Gemmatimonadota bacterium]
MKAAYFEAHGGPELLRVGELPDPNAGAGEVIVAVEATALNHLDLWVRRGLPGLKVPLPHIGGSDFVGRIIEVGEGVEGWQVGERVTANPGLWCGRCEWCQRREHSLCERYGILGEHVAGACAERVRVPARGLVAVPEDFDAEKAAAAPLVYQTAWRALMSRAALSAGETVLITGASGGVSTAAIQIALHAGARVIAVTSGRHVERTRQLGPEHVIDRETEDVAAAVRRLTGRRGVDVVLDSVGQATWKDMVRSLARDGRLVTYGATTGAEGCQDIRLVFWKQLRIIGSTMASQAEFQEVMSMVLDGTLDPVVDVVWPLDRIRDAHERLEAGEQFGKIVLTP